MDEKKGSKVPSHMIWMLAASAIMTIGNAIPIQINSPTVTNEPITVKRKDRQE
ncbi:hypothetical protein M1K46_16735 [Fictibacillus sp. WQ 8-8]|uniref:hypothetical protein n=1 Tax=Fictibacillus sp. WQ 8-8 TaxID=2938788 RepID=UPI00210CA67F|nr:hypothetical protein [Fictibacillus sp. WQ 8-8]MCQ6267285.1 hypothetical protein [Fictibacillus sp. WQ 8-8]